jgi:hypothetical protein
VEELSRKGFDEKNVKMDRKNKKLRK